MRIGTYNVEWFNRLFDNYGVLIDDDSWSSRWDVTKADQTPPWSMSLLRWIWML